MNGLEKRLPLLWEMRKKHLVQLRANQSDLSKDRNGAASNSLGGTLRFIGVADYNLKGDKEAFRANLREAALLAKQLFNRFDAGEAIARSYVSMLSYKALFNALAAGDFELARELAGKMGGRKSVESEYDHPFDRVFGYTLKSFVLDDVKAAQKWLPEFKVICADRNNADFRGYCEVFEGIQAQDLSKAQEGLVAIAKGHKNQSKGGGVFENCEDEVLSVWGVGVANLARISGLPVESPDPLIPADLLI